MASFFYNSFKEYLGDGTIDLDNDTFKVILLDDTYTPSATHSVYADIDGELATEGGYTEGGQELASVTWTRTLGVVTLDFENPTWNDATFTARYAAIYDDTPVEVADPLVLLWDFDGEKSVSNGIFRLILPEEGAFTLSS